MNKLKIYLILMQMHLVSIFYKMLQDLTKTYKTVSLLKLIKKLMKLTKAILDFKNSKIGKNKDS
jgi:hypothetical protein